MSEELKPGPIKGATIRQSLLLGEWQIRTGEYVDKDGWISCRNKYPIPAETLEQIALDWLVKSVDGFENGYSNVLYGKPRGCKRERFKFCIERDGFEEITEREK
jgi:hypothetical protein